MTVAWIDGHVIVKLTIDFGAGPIDVSADVLDEATVTSRRGSPDVFDVPQPAEFTFTLRDVDGDFVPDRRESPHWPGVKLRAPVVWEASFDNGSSWKKRFTGGIDSITVVFPDTTGDEAQVQITASGVLRQYSHGAETIGPSLPAQIAEAGPIAWWRLDDVADSTQFANSIDIAHPLDIGASTTVADTDGPPGDASTRFASVANAIAYGVSSATVRSILMHVTDLTLFNNIFGESMLVFNSHLADLGVNGGASETITAKQAGHTVTSGPMTAENGWYQVIVTLTNTGGTNERLALYVNGALIGTTSFSTTWAAGAGTVQIASAPVGFAHLALFDYPLTVQQASDLWNGAQAWIGETAAARHARITADNDIASTTDPAAATRLGPQPTASVIDILQDGAEAEWGHLVETAGGELNLQARSNRYTDTPAASIRVDGGKKVITDLAPVYDDKDLCNIGTATRPNGATVTDTDADRVQQPPDGEGPYPKSIDVNIESDDDLPHYAAWLVATGVPTTRYPAVPLHFVATSVAELEAWCDLELGDLIELTHLPGQLASDTLLGFLEYYEEAWSFGQVSISAALSPAAPWVDAFTIQDAALSPLGFSGQTIATSAAAGATSISVATSGTNPLMSTAAGDYPMDLQINGYKVHATACSGATSPQTVTVSPLTHAVTSGQEVDLWTEPVLAL